MNKTKQFFTLLKLLWKSNGQLFIIPLFCIGFSCLFDILINHLMNHPAPGLQFDDLLWREWNMVPILACIGFFPSKPFSATINFLLTLPVERSMIVRAFSVIRYFTFLIIPLIFVLLTLKTPEARINTPNLSLQQQVLEQIPGSQLLDKGMLIIPRGNTLVASWNLWFLLCILIGVQEVESLIRSSTRSFLIITSVAACIFCAVLLRGALDHCPAIFLSFVAHQPFYWGITLMSLIGLQLWREDRFTNCH